MDRITSALGPIHPVLWGERAIAALGAPVCCLHYMLVIDDTKYNDAVSRLRLAGFQDCTWSYGSLDPDFYQGHPKKDIYRRIVREYSNLDQNSTRFFFPSDQEDPTVKIVLLPSSYAHIHPSNHRLTLEDDVYYPDASLLLQSFAQTLVREPLEGMWTSSLKSWAISYVYGELMVSDDALDACDDARAKAWFDNKIRRFSGGIDRVTCTKRVGKVNNTG